MSEHRRSERPCPSASTSASPRRSHPATSHRLTSHVAPLPVTEANVEPVCSLISPLPHLLREPLRRAVACELHDRSSHSARRFLPQVTRVWSHCVASSCNSSLRQSPVLVLTPPKPSSSAAIVTPLCQATGAATSAPPSSLSELPHPQAIRPEAALKSSAAIDSNCRQGHPCRRVAPAIS
jgi:hypothetical protein